MHFKKYMKITKNSIISLLLVYILNMYDGWAVVGLAKYIISILLIVAITLLLNEVERIVKNEK